ncbi:MAG: right-handed parallel beta-helix repeat-containing protein [Candidatus Delongbacteria bacterium]|nr:right-handed parallel beta-helix repeat-containing protein [Candidatus Delongbacteria bacterium]
MKKPILLLLLVTVFVMFAKESYISSKQILPEDTTYSRVLESKSLGAIVWDQLDQNQDLSMSAQVFETHVGKKDYGPTPLSSYSDRTYGLKFDVLVPTVLRSVSVYPTSAGTVIIRVLNSSGTVIDSVITSVSSDDINNKTPLQLDIFIPAGTNYKIDAKGSTPAFARNASTTPYPYTSDNVNITGSSVANAYYYYFYDWKVADVDILTESVGPFDNNIGGGGNYTNYTDGLVFDVLSNSTLSSVNVYPNAAGNVTVRLLNSSDAVLESRTIAVSTPGVKTKLDLGFDLVPGAGYKLDAFGTACGGLWRTAGASYPYPSETVVITGAINTLSNYYFFYDWEVSSTGTDPVIDPYNSELAADFILPVQTTLKRFKVKGWFQNTVSAEHSYLLKFYNDSGSKPGEVAIDSTITTFSSPGYEEIIALDFEKPISLSAGTYWIGFQALTDTTEYDVGNVYFRTRSTSSNSTNAYWRNPLDGYNSGSTSFTNAGNDICFALYSEKGVCGYATGTWGTSGSPYYVDGDIMVPDDSVFTVDPGVEFIFRNTYDIKIQGSMNAIGNATDSIRFSAVDDVTGWGGIHLVNDWRVDMDDNDSTRIGYCAIKDIASSLGIQIEYFSKVRLFNSEIFNCTDNGETMMGMTKVVYAEEASPTVEGCVLHDNDYYWVLYHWRDGDDVTTKPVFRNNIVRDNANSVGIHSYNSSLQIINNLVTRNKFGVKISGYYNNPDAFPIMINCTITDNDTGSDYEGGTGLECLNLGDTKIINTIISGNDETGGNQIIIGGKGPQFYNCLTDTGPSEFGGEGGGEYFSGLYLYCINEDPAFQNSTFFTLSQSSPCINGGMKDVSAFDLSSVDIYGSVRQYDSAADFLDRIDIGAVEYQGNPSPMRSTMPEFSLLPGNYVGSQTVNLTAEPTGSSIYYSTDGTYPATIYSGALSINTDTTIRAISYYSGIDTSFVSSAEYKIYPNLMSDTVSGEWSGVIYVDGDLFVPRDSTLTINPGTEVIFLGDYGVEVVGRILAEGAENDSIHFHAENPSIGWKGFDEEDISFFDENFASVYDYCIFNDSQGTLFYAKNKYVEVKNSRISGNEKVSDFQSKNKMLYCDIYNNSYGGYILDTYGQDSLTIKYSKIHHNTCTANGVAGIIDLGYSNSELSYCQIYNNSSTGAEAPVSSRGTNLITNNVIHSNEAKYGGGIFISEMFGNYGTRIYNNTIVFNKSAKGGGIYIEEENDPHIVNNIIYYNTSTAQEGQIYLLDTKQYPGFTHCDIQGGKDAFVIGEEGNFSGLYKYCIDEHPEFLDSTTFDLRLRRYSPCVNYGTVVADSLNLGALDILGNNRFKSTIDIGAIEMPLTPDPEIVLLPQFTPFAGIHDPDVTVTITSPTPGATIYYTTDGTDPDESSNLYTTPIYLTTTTTLKAKGYYTGIEPSFITEAEYKVFPNSISGNVYGTWYKSQSPYYINGNITIPNDSTLTIEAGVEVIFTGYYSCFVEGQLLAQGAENDSITFRPYDENGKWCQIIFDETLETNGASELGYCILEDTSNDQITDGPLKMRYYSNVHVHHSTFRNNISESGGGIVLKSSSPLIENCEFYNNESTMFSGSALRLYEYSDPVVINCKIFNNTGTPVDINDSSPQIINNLIANNQENGWGGALYIYGDSYPVITNNSIVNNSAGYGGGGIHMRGYIDFPSPIIRNTLIYGNTAPEGSQVNINGLDCQPEFNYCNIEGGKEAFGEEGPLLPDYKYLNNISADPKYLGTGPYPYSYKGNSPCINAGSPDSTSLNLPPVDLAGRTRIFNGYVDIIDIGPYEHNGLAMVQYSGSLTDSVRWVADIIEIAGDVTASGMDSLKIVPGVHINFKDDYRVEITDSLVANGTEKDKIIIENAKGGFVLNNTSKGKASAHMKHWIYQADSVIIDDMISITGYDSVAIDSSTFYNVSIIINGTAGKAASSGKKITNNRLTFSSASKGNARTAIKIFGDDKVALINNEITNADTGIVIQGSGLKANGSGKKITNNRLTFSSAVKDKGTTVGILFDNTAVDSLYHNSIYDMGEGIKAINQTSTIEVLNNIIWNDDDQITQIIDPDSKLILKNNDISGTTDYNTGGNSGNINDDPLFVNPAIGDLHLNESSPCIGQALVILGYPSYHAPDIGALEYGLSFSTPYNLAATGDLGVINLSWNSPYKSNKILTQYYVYRDGTKIDSTSSTNYSDTDVENNVEYTYHITAMYSTPDGESGPSNYITFTALTEFSSPSYLVGGLSGEAIELSWILESSSKALVQFNIYKNGTLIDSCEAMSYTDTTSMTNMTSYDYYVTSVYEYPTAESVASDTISVTMYKPPVNLTYETSGSTVFISWDTPVAKSEILKPVSKQNKERREDPVRSDPKDALTGYLIYKNNILLYTITDPDKDYFYDYGVVDGTHEYKIKATYTGGNSGYSSAMNVTVSGGITYALNEGFEGSSWPPDGWTLYDGDGINTSSPEQMNWFHLVEADAGSGIVAHSGLNCAGSVSMEGATENWLISPAVDLTGNTNVASLRYYTTYAYTPSEHYKIMVSTATNSPEDFTELLYEFTPSSKIFDTWYETELDLSDYAGQTVYLAWIHEQESNMFIILDDITVSKYNTTELATPANVTLVASGGNITITWDRIMKDQYLTYIVYSSDDLITWTIEESNISDTSWTESIVNARKFYRIVATDSEPTKKVKEINSETRIR